MILTLSILLRSREISWASGMDFPIPPEFWWSTDILLIINPSTGMDQEIYPCGQGRIDSVKINASLLRMRECLLGIGDGFPSTSLLLVEHGYTLKNLHCKFSYIFRSGCGHEETAKFRNICFFQNEDRIKAQLSLFQKFICFGRGWLCLLDLCHRQYRGRGCSS